RILNGGHGLRMAVLINDFGAINIDAELIVDAESNVISLANGCICCQIRDDLIEAVMDVMSRPEQVEYIIIEASGVADPSAIAVTFTLPAFRESIRLDSVISVVDAGQIFAYPDKEQLLRLKLHQIAFSDLVILNKVDLIGETEVEEIKVWINQYVRRIRVVEAKYCDVPSEILLAVGRFDPERLAKSGDGNEYERGSNGYHDDDHGQAFSTAFSTWSYESDQPHSLKALHRTVANLPESVYRAKGVVYATDAPKQRAVLQMVGRRVEVALESGWGDQTPRTQIVAIGAPGSIDAETLTQKF
ncbi:MAG: GTP-binding protein, partial [Burkholderiales bacterium]|nr:GTP-binding protein [Burkholderiales bacterium]